MACNTIREWELSQDPDWGDVHIILDMFSATAGGSVNVNPHHLLREVKRLKGNAEHLRAGRKRQQERYAEMESRLAKTSARLADVYAIVSKCVAPYEYTPAFKAKMYDHIVERLYPLGVAGNLHCPECGYRESVHPHVRCTRGQLPTCPVVGCVAATGGCYCDFDDAECRRRGHQGAAKQEWERAKDNT